jgi:hypothetical protein
MSPENVENGVLVEVSQGQVCIGKELTEFQLLLKEWFFTSLTIGTCFFYGVQVLLIVGWNWYWERKRRQRHDDDGLVDDDNDDDDDIDGASEIFRFDGTSTDGSDRNGWETNRNHWERNEDASTGGSDRPYVYDVDEEYFDGQEGEWEDLPPPPQQSSSTGVTSQPSGRDRTDGWDETGPTHHEVHDDPHTIPDDEI